MKNDPIYVITIIVNEDVNSNTRCVGFYHDLTSAIESVQNNDGDMHENYYKYAVIEEKFPGINCTNTFHNWFVWFDSWYIPCDVPDTYKNMINFGIG